MTGIITAAQAMALALRCRLDGGNTLEALEDAITDVTGIPYRVIELHMVHSVERYFELIGLLNDKNTPGLS